MSQKRTILITGCSEGGLGDALAQALHRRGQYVIATARNPAKMNHYKSLGIETLTLDVLSQSSISSCVAAVVEKTGGVLDMLINNSGSGYSMPLVDADLKASRNVFEVNVWALLEVTRSFLPLLLRSKAGAIIVNNTSTVSLLPIPMGGIYNASKAAAAMLTDNLRLELLPFQIKVVELKTGAVKSRFYDNQEGGSKPCLPKDSLYNLAKANVEDVMAGGHANPRMIDCDLWAQDVVAVLLQKSPPSRIWKGGNASSLWFASAFLPSALVEAALWRVGRLEDVRRKYRPPTPKLT